MIAQGPTVRSARRSQDGTVSGILDHVDPTGVLSNDEREALAELVADEMGTHLSRFHSWTITRYSLDSTATVTLHAN